MTATDPRTVAPPRLRPEVLLGPGLTEGPRVVHHLKDPRTNWYFRVGPREFFVISRLDGTHTMDEIGSDYTARFGRRLGEQHWQQIMGLLWTRRLLAGTEDDDSIAELADAAKRGVKQERRSLFQYRRPLVNPDRLFGRLEPRLRFLYSAYFVIPALVAIVALATGLGLHWTEFFADTRRAWHDPPVMVASIAVFWLSLAIHESAHGMTCKHFGGSAPEIGIIWRFPILAPYCKADDVVLFESRWHRVYTAFAGIFAGLVVMLPFGVIWAVAPQGSTASVLTASILFLGAAGALVNLLPFLQLDGYFMLNHALGMSNLRSESYRFWGRLAARILRRGDGMTGYAGRTSVAYAVYGAGSIGYGLALSVRAFSGWYRGLRHWVSPALSFTILGGLLAAGVFAAVFSRRRARERRAGIRATVAADAVTQAAVTPAAVGRAGFDSSGGGS